MGYDFDLDESYALKCQWCDELKPLHQFKGNEKVCRSCRKREKARLRKIERCARCEGPVDLDEECARCRMRGVVLKSQSVARAHKHGQYIMSELVYPNAVYARDMHRCKLCGLPVLMHVAAGHPLSPTVDHIVPLYDGGNHSEENCQTAHHSCNSQKSNRQFNPTHRNAVVGVIDEVYDAWKAGLPDPYDSYEGGLYGR